MSTIEELKKLQKFNVNEAKPLTIKGQYSKNTNVDLNKTIKSVSLLTNELNDLNSNVKQSALNLNTNFSMDEWVNDTKNSLLNQLFPSIQTLISNQKPLTKTITLTNTIITTSIQSTLNQQDKLINQLENQTRKLIEKQNNIKVEKDENGNVTIIPVLTENAKKSLDNTLKILTSITTTLDKVNTRISNNKPLKNVDDFINNLSLEHVIEFSQKIISTLILILQIKIKIRQARDLTAAANSAALGNVAAAADYTQKATEYTSTEQRQMDDLASAQLSITIIKEQILFFQNLLQITVDNLKNIINLLNRIQSQTNPQTQQLLDKLQTLSDTQQNTIDSIKKTLIEPTIIQIPKPYYAAKLKK